MIVPRPKPKAPRTGAATPSQVTATVRGPGNPMTATEMKQIMGWDEAKEGERALFTDYLGKKIVLRNNGNNRPFHFNLAEKWAQEVLRGRWRLNGETWIVGAAGRTLSLQHRGAGLVLAAQAWAADPDRYPAWVTEPTMQGIMVTGVSEDDTTVNTLDTARPRTLSDVIYRMPVFADLDHTGRQECSSSIEDAIREVQGRTGTRSEGVEYKTHSESVEYFLAHPKLAEAIRHIQTEYGGRSGPNRPLIGMGTAAALLYLMGVSATKDEYDPKQGDLALDFSQWDKACDFWTLLLKRSAELDPVRRAIAGLSDPDDPTTGHVANKATKIVLIIKGWSVFVAGQTIKDSDLKVKTKEDKYGVIHLVDNPLLGGVDKGNPRFQKDIDTAPDPSPQEIAAATANGPKSKNGTPTVEEDELGVWLGQLRKRHPDRTFLFVENGSVHAWGGDAEAVHEVCGIEVGKLNGRGHVQFPTHHLDYNAKLMHQHDPPYPVAVVRGTFDSNEIELFKWEPPPRNRGGRRAK